MRRVHAMQFVRPAAVFPSGTPLATDTPRVTFGRFVMHRVALRMLLVAAIVGCRDAGPTDPRTAALNLPGLSIPYAAVDLGTLGGGSSVATDINDDGQIVGSSATASGALHAFRWQDGVMTDLGSLGGDTSEATDINAAGQVAGQSIDASGARRAFLWSDGVMQDLGPAGRFLPVRLNARGQVAWSTRMLDGTMHALLWSDGVAQDLGTLGGSTEARAINDRGQVVGSSNGHAFLWDGGNMQDLGSLGGSAWAADINNQGQIAGASYAADRSLHALLWDNGQMTDLGSVAGNPNAYAVAINDLTQVAGVSVSQFNYDRGKPFRWQAGVLLPLNPNDDLRAMDEHISGMNQLGVVAGTRTLSRYHVAVVSENGARWELPALADSGTTASAINRGGDVVGLSGSDPNTWHAVLWRRVSSGVVAALPQAPPIGN